MTCTVVRVKRSTDFSISLKLGNFVASIPPKDVFLPLHQTMLPVVRALGRARSVYDNRSQGNILLLIGWGNKGSEDAGGYEDNRETKLCEPN